MDRKQYNIRILCKESEQSENIVRVTKMAEDGVTVNTQSV